MRILDLIFLCVVGGWCAIVFILLAVAAIVRVMSTQTIRQSLLADELCSNGLDTTDDPLPATPIALIQADLDEFANLHGLALQTSHDDLGPLSFAYATLGELPFMIVGHHDNSRDVTVDVLDQHASPETAQLLLAALNVSGEHVVWTYPRAAV